MRKYTDKKDVQKKAYYSDRFFVAPMVPRVNVDADEIFQADLDALSAKFSIKESYIEAGQLVLIIDAKDNFAFIKMLKEEQAYTQLSEMSAIDWIADKGEFEIFYQLLSMSKRKRLRVKCSIAQDEAIESVTPLFRLADWAEREMYDMFGVIVNNHPYMKRLLMPDDWEGHLLLKTYPLQGDDKAQWYEVDKIFGKEYRDIIGPENRDASRIDVKDTKNFSRIKHEVLKGAKYSEDKTSLMRFQEEDGVFMITKFDKQVTLDKRK